MDFGGIWLHINPTVRTAFRIMQNDRTYFLVVNKEKSSMSAYARHQNYGIGITPTTRDCAVSNEDGIRPFFVCVATPGNAFYSAASFVEGFPGLPSICRCNLMPAMRHGIGNG